MKKYVYLFLFIIFLSACKDDANRKKHSLHQPEVVEARGYVVPKDSISEPKVFPIDVSKLKKFPVGNPKIVATNLNVNPAGEPKIVLIGSPKIITPGTDTFSLPKIVPAIDSPFIAKQPKPIPALSFRMKDAATCNIQYLDVEQGMSSSYIRSILKDKTGNLWFGTRGGGVSKYDGKSFSHYTEKEGLSSNYIMSILEDKTGNLWFGTNGGGVSKYDGKSFTHYSKNEGLCNKIVLSILEDKIGNLWFGTSGGGVSKYDGKSFIHYTGKEGLSNNKVLSILEDKIGNLWFGTDGGGVSKYDGKSFTHFTEKEGLSSNYIMSILEDKTGNLWFGTNGGGVSKYDGKSFTHFTEKEGLSNNTVLSILEDKTRNLWFGTNGGGVSKYNGKSFTHYTDKEGLSNNSIRSILEDKTGNIWFGTDGGGVSKYDGKSFTHYTEKEGLSNHNVRSILEDKTGNLWFGARDGGVSKYDGKSFTHYTEKEGFSSNIVWSILEDKTGNLWFGTYGGGVMKYNGKSFTHFTEKEGLSNNTVLSILEDKTGNLWFGTDGGGVSKYDGKSLTHYTDKEGLSNNSVWSILEDKTGNLWFGTDGGGVSKYDGNSFTHYTEKEGLSNNSVRSILEDKNGNLWFGTRGGGVSKYDGKSFTHFTEKEGLSNNIVRSILKDKTGNLWLSTEKGLNLLVGVTSTKLQKKQDIINPEIIVFHKEDGLKAEDFFQNSALLSSKNQIWWGSGKALSMLDLNEFKLNKKEPEIQLDNIYLQENFADYRHLNDTLSDSVSVNENNEFKNIQFSGVANFHNYPEELELPYYLNHITFNFSAIDWYAPHKIKYQYKLEGLDQDWSKLTADNKADYRNIPYGSYTIKVKAIGCANKWSKTFEYSFVINPPWYKTYWAYGVYSILLLSLVFGYSNWRTRALKQKQKELKYKVEEATLEIRQQKEVVEVQKQLIEEKHKEITDSINYAERIQRSFLATKELLDENLQDYFVFFQPKGIVSGDFYWASKLNDGRFAYVCADSTGHGVPGAIMSLLNITSIEKAIESLNEPSEILNVTRKIIIERLKKDGSKEGGKDGMDASLVVFNKDKTKLTYAAANNPIWIIRKNEMGYSELLEAKPDKMPIGKHDKEGVPFNQYEIELQKDDLIYCLTDGMADQFGGPKGKKYKSTQLKEFLLSISKLSLPDQHLRLKSEFETWKGGFEQVDDLCVIGIRI